MRLFTALAASALFSFSAEAAPVTMELTFDGLSNPAFTNKAHFTFDPATTLTVNMTWGCGSAETNRTPTFTDASGTDLCAPGFDGVTSMLMDLHTVGAFDDFGGAQVFGDPLSLLAWGQDFGAVRFAAPLAFFCQSGGILQCSAFFAEEFVFYSEIFGDMELFGSADSAGGFGGSTAGNWTAAPIVTPLPGAAFLFTAGIGFLGLGRRRWLYCRQA